MEKKKNLLEAFKEFNEQYPDAFDWAFWYEKDETKLIDAQLLYQLAGLELDLTCGACPEQYEVFKGKKQVGYLRLRHGSFRVDFPDCGGETIYTASPRGDGMFEADERIKYLGEALQAILKKMSSDQNDERIATQQPML